MSSWCKFPCPSCFISLAATYDDGEVLRNKMWVMQACTDCQKWPSSTLTLHKNHRKMKFRGLQALCVSLESALEIQQKGLFQYSRKKGEQRGAGMKKPVSLVPCRRRLLSFLKQVPSTRRFRRCCLINSKISGWIFSFSSLVGKHKQSDTGLTWFS